VSSRTGLHRACLAFLFLLGTPPLLLAQSASRSPETDLDAFMAKVLARREENRLTLERYVLDETEEFEVLGPGRAPLYRRQREFTWYVRDGLHVRSPVRFGGVAVGDRDRTAYEENWMRRERARLERRKKQKEDATGKAEPEPAAEPPIDLASGAAIPEPRFVSEAYFLEFKFEPGNYYLAGRERLEGKEVLRIEYYPTRLFEDDDPPEKRKRDKGQEYEDRINRQMNKTALITLWIDPAEHQIVKYTFDNVWMDFLPGAWLVRIDEIGASMEMGQPFPGIWLPRAIAIKAGATLANGSFDASYDRRFSSYRLAEVTTRITIPKAPEPAEARTLEPAREGGRSLAEARPPEQAREGGPFVLEDIQASETIAEIRVHGNAFMADADVIRVAGFALGQPVDDARLAEIERRLKESGLFDSVEVRKRYRSLADASAVAVLLVVHEKPGVTSAPTEGDVVNSSWRRFRSRLMFLPILTYADGYGFTYGGRVSTVDLLGAGERFSVPLTWGGTRRAALEFEETFERGPLTRVTSSFGIAQRENPHFEIDDRRVEWRGRVERRFLGLLRAGVETSTASVDFGSLDERLWTIGADVALDTRGDPAFPRNAVYVGAGWTALDVKGPAERVNRYAADARGYLGLLGQSVLAARAQFTGADAALPEYERLLVGGSSTLRGFRAGAFSGDRALVTSVEIRLPITSVLRSARLGVVGFADAARVYDVGQRFDDAEWHRAAGAGVFLIASFVRLNLDVAHGFTDGDTRVHFGMGFAF
jgi:hypothetical protein